MTLSFRPEQFRRVGGLSPVTDAVATNAAPASGERPTLPHRSTALTFRSTQHQLLAGHQAAALPKLPAGQVVRPSRRLCIRSRQYKELAFTLLREELSRLDRYCTTGFADKPFIQDARRRRGWIAEGVRHAASYGVLLEEDIKAFLALRAMFGNDFDQEQEWAKAVLWNGQLTGTQKMDSLVEAATFTPPIPPGKGG